MARTGIMAGNGDGKETDMYISIPSPYSIEKVWHFPYTYPINAEFFHQNRYGFGQYPRRLGYFPSLN